MQNMGRNPRAIKALKRAKRIAGDARNKQYLRSLLGQSAAPAPKSKANRRAQIVFQAASPTTSNGSGTPSRKSVRSRLDSLGQQFKLSPADIKYLECVCDPFGQDSHHDTKSNACGIPDSDSSPNIVMVLTARSVFSGATSTYLHITGVMPASATATMYDTAYGADELAATSLANGASVNAYEQTMAAPYLAVNNQYRIVTQALRVQAISAPVNTSGLIYCGRSPLSVRSAAAVYRTNGDFFLPCHTHYSSFGWCHCAWSG